MMNTKIQTECRPLPIGIQTFSILHEEGYYYVDKTPLIRELIRSGRHYFLSRPRRFQNLLKEAFTWILVGEIETPGSFSVRTLQILGGISQRTAESFRRAVSISIQLTADNVVHDARICSMGGKLGQNCLKEDDLSYDVLIDLTENGLVHPDYNCQYPYDPLPLEPETLKKFPRHDQFPFSHQGKSWKLISNENSNATKQLRVEGTKFTSYGIELLRIVDLEPLPDFTNRLKQYFSGKGYRMVPATNQ